MNSHLNRLINCNGSDEGSQPMFLCRINKNSPNTNSYQETTAPSKLAKNVYPDVPAHNYRLSHLDLQCLPDYTRQLRHFILELFGGILQIKVLQSAFLAIPVYATKI